MPTDDRADLIRQLQSLLDEIMDDVSNPYTRARINAAKQIVRKLAKPDGGDGHEAA